MTDNRKLKVFLCHSKDDKPKVRELYRHLVADGFDAWLDEEKLMPGQEWDLEIRKAVRKSDVVVVCLSKGSVTKTGYVQKEIRFALDVADEQPEGAIYLIPLRLEDCEVPSRLGKWQWVDLFESKGYEKLKLSLGVQADAQGADTSYFIEPEMVQIPAGKFLMGSTVEQIEQAINDGADKDWVELELPQHTVELSEYLIGKYPITNREYQAFIHSTKYIPPSGWDGDQFPAKKSDHPVVYVSWNDASAYCTWLSEKTNKRYRLPTEAEWEKASRGNDGRMWSWGNEFGRKNANTSETNIGNTTPVGQFSPHGDSPYGCADMIGNVWEWCDDWFDEYEDRTHKILKDPQGPQVGNSRIIRGGAFSRLRNLARCAYRDDSDINTRDYGIGFRVALSPSK